MMVGDVCVLMVLCGIVECVGCVEGFVCIQCLGNLCTLNPWCDAHEKSHQACRLVQSPPTPPGASLARKGSIGSPASAKNAIAVGASLSFRSARPLIQGPVLSARAITPVAMERLRIAGPSVAAGPALSLVVLNVSFNAPGYSLLQAEGGVQQGGGSNLSALPADVVALLGASRYVLDVM